jgi:hypothetical protein
VGQTPASPVISLGDGELTIAWTALPGTAAAYEIWMAETNDSASALKQGDDITGTLSKAISGLTNGTVYYLWLKARNFTGESNLSPVAAGKPIATPGAPTLVPENAQLTVTWTAAAGADDYEVYYGVDSANTLFDTVSGTSAVITGLTNETTYQVRLRGKNETGVSAYGASASGMPQITAGLYKGASLQDSVRIGDQNLSNSLAYIATNALAGDNYYIVLGANESIRSQILGYSEQTIGITLMGIGKERQITFDYGTSALFTINTGVTLTLDDKIALIRRYYSYPLVRVSNDGFLVMNAGSKITGNTSSSNSSVSVSGGTFTMKGGEISGNSGNGVSIDSNGTFTMGGGKISYNSSRGVSVSGGTFTMEGGEISDNSGDGVSIGSNGTFTMKGGEISYNSGKGIYFYDGTFTMKDGEISYNSGGGVYVPSNKTFTMEGGMISGNTTSSFGGGVYISGGTFAMEGGAISGNTTSSFGGGVYISGGTFAMEGGAINGNTASSGGGVYVSNGTFTMEGGAISGNTASSGGGVYVSGETFTMKGGEISGNTASSSIVSHGGGVYVHSGRFSKTSEGGIVYGNNASPDSLQNSALGDGDAVYRLEGVKKRDSTIAADEEFHSNRNTGWD